MHERTKGDIEALSSELIPKNQIADIFKKGVRLIEGVCLFETLEYPVL